MTEPLTKAEEQEDASARPAVDPPPLRPCRNFEMIPDSAKTIAVELIAEILMDDLRHDIEDVLDEVVYETEMQRQHARKLLKNLQQHGDVRINQWGVRLTTRWQEYRA